MILVVGATGSLGGSIARALLEQGKPVRVFVRDGSAYDHLVEAGADSVVGDLKNPGSVRAACVGVDAIVTTANSVGRGGADTVESVDLHGNQTLIDAATAEHVGRFVFTSALGAAPDAPMPFLQAKGAAEAHLRETSMASTILQPNLYMDTWLPMIVGGPALAAEPVTLVGEGKRQHSMVAMHDVVGYALAALEGRITTDEPLVIGGPEPICWWDAVAAFERELGRDLSVRTIPLGEAVPGLPEAVNNLFQALEFYDSPIDMTDAAARYGVEPTTLATFVHGFVGAVSA
jgi:uncharacterized protein YbjT (DUF2867 family)